MACQRTSQAEEKVGVRGERGGRGGEGDEGKEERRTLHP